MKQIRYMAPFKHRKRKYTPNCLVIKRQKVNVVRIGYKYSKINKIIFSNENKH